MTLIDWMNNQDEDSGWNETEMHVHMDGKVFVQFEGENGKPEIEEIKTEVINGAMYYGIGSWSWCWQACNTEAEATEVY